MVLLVIDDSKIIRERLVAMLAELTGSPSVRSAANGPTGLDAARQLRPDIITVDIRMPGMDGITLVREIRQILPNATIIVLTNFAYPQYRRRSLDSGADYFLDKHREFEEVAKIVTRLSPPSLA